MVLTVLMLAKTLARKCSSPLCDRLAGSETSTPGAALTNASSSRGSARTSLGSAEG